MRDRRTDRQTDRRKDGKTERQTETDKEREIGEGQGERIYGLKQKAAKIAHIHLVIRF